MTPRKITVLTVFCLRESIMFHLKSRFTMRYDIGKVAALRISSLEM